MEEMKKIVKYTDREWEELASLLSGEQDDSNDFVSRFMDEDSYNTVEQWKELKDMSDQKINVDNAWHNVYSRLNENGIKTHKGIVRRSSLKSITLRIAAVALILLGLISVIVTMNNSGYLSKKITVVTGNDEKNILVALPDGSKIYLNRNSELSYRGNFGKRTRNVHLTGEAFFDIASDASKPFVIDAGKAMVKVVGTSFNVITKNPDSAVEVYVKTGKVLLTDDSGSQSLTLDPGFVGRMDSKISEKNVNNDPNYLSWNTGVLVYSGQKLDVVFRDLKRVYNMDIVADNPSILDNPWTITIDNKSQEIIINTICEVFNLSYTKVGNVYHLSEK